MKNNSRFLIFLSQIYIPLVALFAISVLLHKLLNLDGFFLNLATEIVGIIITIAYVDWILQRQESEKWKETRIKIITRLQFFVDTSIINIGLAANMVITFSDEDIENARKKSQAVSEIIRNSLNSDFKDKFLSTDKDGWKRLGKALFYTHSQAEKMLDVFIDKIEPAKSMLLLQIQEQTRIILGRYSEFSEAAGMPYQFFGQEQSDFYDREAVRINIKPETNKDKKGGRGFRAVGFATTDSTKEITVKDLMLVLEELVKLNDELRPSLPMNYKTYN